ncbi:Com family DNA-binding transcriptional regulator [Klebsiella pneumoniae]|nr:Com family DNA-binding transcriptional regulator [Klebsiella pneumoniae]
MGVERCLRCNKMLFNGSYIRIQIKCPRCGYINELSAPERHGQETESVRSTESGG